MADNYITNAGAGGVTFASDEDVGLIHWPFVKLVWGVRDAFNEVADAAGKRLPVDAVQSGAWSVSITGSVAVTGPLTDAQLRATAVPVSGAFFQATQPVSIAATVTVDTELPAAAVLADNTGNPTAPAVAAFLMGWDGAAWDRVGVSAGGALKVDGSAFTQPVSGTVTLGAGVANIGDVDVLTLPALPAGANNIGDVDVLTVPADPFGVNADAASATGSISAKLRFIAATGIPITALPASTNTLEMVGDAAHDAAIAGNPVRIGARALSADFAAVATGDVADLIASLLGKQVILPHALPAATWQFAGATGGIVDTTAVTIKAAGAAGVRNYMTALQVINGHATVSTEVAIRDGAAGTVIHRGFAQAAGGGYALQFPTPLRGTAATLLEVVCITTGAAVRVSAQGYQAAE